MFTKDAAMSFMFEGEISCACARLSICFNTTCRGLFSILVISLSSQSIAVSLHNGRGKLIVRYREPYDSRVIVSLHSATLRSSSCMCRIEAPSRARPPMRLPSHFTAVFRAPTLAISSRRHCSSIIGQQSLHVY